MKQVMVFKNRRSCSTGDQLNWTSAVASVAILGPWRAQGHYHYYVDWLLAMIADENSSKSQRRRRLFVAAYKVIIYELNWKRYVRGCNKLIPVYSHDAPRPSDGDGRNQNSEHCAARIIQVSAMTMAVEAHVAQQLHGLSLSINFLFFDLDDDDESKQSWCTFPHSQ